MVAVAVSVAAADVDEAPAAVMTSAASTTSQMTTRRTRPPPVLAARIVPPGPAPPLYHNRSGRFAAESAFFLLVPATHKTSCRIRSCLALGRTGATYARRQKQLHKGRMQNTVHRGHVQTSCTREPNPFELGGVPVTTTVTVTCVTCKSSAKPNRGSGETTRKSRTVRSDLRPDDGCASELPYFRLHVCANRSM